MANISVLYSNVVNKENIVRIFVSKRTIYVSYADGSCDVYVRESLVPEDSTR